MCGGRGSCLGIQPPDSGNRPEERPAERDLRTILLPAGFEDRPLGTQGPAFGLEVIALREALLKRSVSGVLLERSAP
jgi:hypothetical protein